MRIARRLPGADAAEPHVGVVLQGLEIARSACASAAAGVRGSASGRPSAATRKSCASWESANDPPRTRRRPRRRRRRRSRRGARAPRRRRSWPGAGRSRRPAAASAGRRARWRAWRAPARGRAARAGWRAGGRRPACGSPSPNSRPTASQARAAPSSAAPCSRSRGWPAIVSALVTVSRSRLALVEHEVEPEERLEAPAEARLGAPHALRDRAHPPAIRGIEVQDPVGLAVADAAQHDRLRLQGAGHRRYYT